MQKNLVTLLRKESDKFKDYLILITSNSKDYREANIKILDYFINEKKIPGVYVTLNRPHQIIQRELKSNNINPDTIIFIDAATKNKGLKRIKNCLFIGSPEKLSDISVAADQAIKALPSEKFLFFDSFDTLSIFNNRAVVSRFAHFLSGKIREWKAQGIIVSLKKDSEKEIIDEVSEFSDLRIDL